MKKNKILIPVIIAALEAVCIICLAAVIFKADNRSEECLAQAEAAQSEKESLSLENNQLLAEKESLEEICSEASDTISSYEEYIDELNERLLEPESTGAAAGSGKKYESLYPDMYAGDHLALAAEGKTAYLTFDDGPSVLTPEVLDVLDRYGIKATFFVTYKDKAELRKYYREITDRGHTIAVHTASHDYAAVYKSAKDYLDDFYKMYNCIYEETGVRCSLFRFPGGSHNGYKYGDDMPDIISEMERRGFIYYDWNVSSGDGGNWVTGADELQRVKEQSAGRDRVVVLMHDSASKTVTLEALPDIIEYLESEGYAFDSLSPELEPVQFKRWTE